MGVYLRDGSPYWWYAFKLDGKRRISASTGTADKKLAVKVYHAKRSEAQQVSFGFLSQKIKLKDLMNDYLELYSRHNKRNHGDDAGKINKLSGFFGDVYVHEVNPSKLEEYRLHRLGQKITKNLDRTISKATVNREMALLKHIFSKGIEWGKCAENPVKKIKFYSEKERRRMNYLDDVAKVRLLNACSPSLRRLVFFALQTGMRQGEILGLKWKNVDFKANIIEITHSKAGKPRYVPSSSELSDMLKSLPTVSEYVFGTVDGKADWTLFRKPFEAAVRKAGLTDMHFHDLRHCFASDLVMKGVDLKTVSELLGHASTQMTERYSHLSPAHKRIAIEMLPKGLMCYTGATVEKVTSQKPQETIS